MKVLVAIANYGSSNNAYLPRVLDEYRSMRYEVHLVVLSDMPKSLGSDVEVVVGLPSRNPRSLPFAHKALFAERIEQYDLFIYSEDDTLLTETNIDAFLRATSLLRENEIAGFVRSETGSDGQMYISTAHGHFHWLPDSARHRGGSTFARFSNDHSACFLLTRDQLRRAIASGGFLVPPHEGRYALLETAATDPYTQCGLEKLICISELDDFVIPHLPNKYMGALGVGRQIFQKLSQALLTGVGDGRPSRELLKTETKLAYAMWSKSYYEPCQMEALSLIPPTCRRVLSIGCGWGATEAALVQMGVSVVAVPLDQVIATCADAAQVRIVYGGFDSAREQLRNETFDCLLFSNILHLVPDPLRILNQFVDLLSSQGVVIAVVPNFARLPILWRRLRRHPAYRALGHHETSGLHLTSYRKVRGWFGKCRLNHLKVVPILPKLYELPHRLSLGLARDLLASELVVAGRRD